MTKGIFGDDCHSLRAESTSREGVCAWCYDNILWKLDLLDAKKDVISTHYACGRCLNTMLQDWGETSV